MVKNALQLLLLIVSFSLTQANFAKIIMVFGDSISAGYGLDNNSGWVKLLEKRVTQSKDGYTIINASISGNTSGNGLGRIKTDLDLHNPDILILELGGNDGLRGHSLTVFKSNMEKMIKLSQTRGIQVLLLGIKLPPSYGRRYSLAFDSVYIDLAESYDLPLVPFFMDKVGVNKELMQRDGIHPNAKGQPLLLDNVWPFLEPML
ncbi:MAG: arylesterase [Gammaproteobacteria bacterium]|nr:arylesterase [Gammaproteobacteria bacterium]